MPKEAEEYVHRLLTLKSLLLTTNSCHRRIGRTGRVGNTGRATTFVDTQADCKVIPKLVKILVDAGQPVPDWMTGGSGGYGGGHGCDSYGRGGYGGVGGGRSFRNGY